MESDTSVRPTYVWLDKTGGGRMVHALFRREFELSSVPDQALINLFADSHYQLYVNGVHLAFGPARFYPEYPLFDTHNLSDYLREGINVIAVHALHIGLDTYIAMEHPAGFAAWGIIEGSEQPVDLATPGDWIVTQAPGHDQQTAKYSFTSAPFQIYDDRVGIQGWHLPERPHADWHPVIPVDHQDSWGPLEPRTIPYLEYEERVAKRLLGAYQHYDGDAVLSFRMSGPSEDGHQPRRDQTYGYTYIHSEKDQEVLVHLFWGEHYLNGQRVTEVSRGKRIASQDFHFQLKAGWNFYFFPRMLVTSNWEFTLVYPRSAGLSFSPTKALNDPVACRVAGPFECDSELVGATNPETFTSEPPELPGGWHDCPHIDFYLLPRRHIAWTEFDGEIHVPGSRPTNLTLMPDEGDASFIFDMGGLTLGRIFVEYDAPEGTILDVGFAEQLQGIRPKVGKNVMVFDAERQISRGGEGRFETYFPRGFRYMQVAVARAGGSVSIKRVGAVSQIYPHRKVGAFRSSDPLLNRIWEMGWNTLRVCSEDVYTDCPWRERTLYGGDMLPEAATALATSGDVALTKRCLTIFIESGIGAPWQQSMAPMSRQREGLFDYPMVCLTSADWMTRYKPDIRFARFAFSEYAKLMDKLLARRRDDGLFEHFYKPFLDWCDIDKLKEGTMCAVNALAVVAFRALASLAETCGDTGASARYREIADTTANAIQATFWDDAAGAYADHIEAEGKLADNHHVVTQAYCLFAGLPTAGQAAKIQAKHEATTMKVKDSTEHKVLAELGCPYGAFYMIGGLYRYGYVDWAEQFMQLMWRRMAETDSDTIWEMFEDSKSCAHAWSTAPTYYMATRALGVHLGLPDDGERGRVTVAPQSENLHWAEGTVPHPAGPVSVKWEKSGDTLKIEVTVPAGVPCDIRPAGSLADLKLESTIREV